MGRLVVVDVETDGPVPGLYSMVSFGAVVFDNKLDKRFYGTVHPISKEWVPEALAVSGFSREETLEFEDPKIVLERFEEFLKTNCKGSPILISDNNQFDGMFIAYYFHKFLGKNPFGFSSRRITDLWSGYNNDMTAKWKHLRKTKHTHNALDDALGNAEALHQMKKEGLNLF